MKYDLNKILNLVSRRMGHISEVKKLKSVTADVYKINKNECVLKIYSDKSLSKNMDVKIIKRFGDFNGLMKIIYLYEKNNGTDFTVTEYIDGELLSDVVNKINPSVYYKDLCGFFKECNKIKMKNYGRLSKSFGGSHKSWLRFILDLEKRIYYRSINFGKLIGVDLHKLREFTISLLKDRKLPSVLIPVDLNLSNFIITKKRKLRIIEIESWFAGDSLFPYGLLLSHTWKTPLYNQIIKDKLIQRNIKISLFYSLLESLSVISFNKKFYPNKLKTLKPFGNNLSFINILNEQKKILGL